MICNSEKVDNNAEYDNRIKEYSLDETRRERYRHQQPNTRFGSHEDTKAPDATTLVSGFHQLCDAKHSNPRDLIPIWRRNTQRLKVPAASRILALHDSMATNQLQGFSAH
jgi:hypothetical protein